MDNNWAGWETFKLSVQMQLDARLEGDVEINPANSPRPALPQIQRCVEGTIDGRPANFEAYLINNVTYVPLRPLIEALKIRLEWNADKYHIHTKQ